MAFLSPRHSSRSLMLIATLAWTTAMTTGARAQIAAADLRKAAEKIAAIQKEARLHEQRGHGAEAVRLREEAQKVWNETVGRIATSIEGKRRAEEAMSSIAANERGQAAAKELQAAASAWKSGQATASWMSQCTKGPAACLQGISKAKTAIEKGFDAASHQVDANVHVATAQQTEQIRAAKETQRRDLEKVRDALDRVSDPIDYPNDATSHNRDAPAPVAIHGELGENAAPARGGIYWDAVSASAATGSTVPGDDHPHPTDADYAALLDAVGSQGHVAGNSNAVSTGARDDSFRFASEFAQTETTERNRLKDATREIERSAKAADAIDVSTPASPPEATVPKSAQSSHPAASGDAPADPKRPITAKAAASTVPMDCRGKNARTPKNTIVRRQSTRPKRRKQKTRKKAAKSHKPSDGRRGMMNTLTRSLCAIFSLMILTVSEGAAEKARPKNSGASAPKPAASKAPVKVEPRLVALNVEKCVGCQTMLRKRVALMPVKVGALAGELNLSAEAVATMVRDQLEAELATRAGLLVLSRSELPDVVAEQRISDSAAANQELAPVKGKIIPAQFVIVATIDRIDAQETSRKESNSSAESYERDALEKEREADDLEREADAKENERVYSNTAAYIGVACAAGGLFCAGYQGQAYLDCYQRAQQKQAECNERAKEEQERDLERKRDQNARQASDKRASAAAIRREAQRMRQQAAIEAQQNITVTQTKSVQATMVWKAVDTATSAVVASGSASGIGNDTQRGVSQTSAYRSTSTTNSARYQGVINEAIAQVVTNLARAVEDKLATEPFRAKIVRVSPDNIVINGGTNVGMAAGDTFGVRKKHEVLTDPDTGIALESPGPPIGVIRVSEVNEKTAIAQVIRTAGPLDRGDELEWIGMYQIAAQDAP